MDKALKSASSSQKYSAVKDEDFEESGLEESGRQRAVSDLATHERRQRSLNAKFLVSREVLVVHLAWILLLILSIFFLQTFTPALDCPVPRLPSDEIFGEIPFRVVTWEQDEGFVKSDPMDGKRWNRSQEAGVTWTPWDDIHPGSWVKVQPSSELGISGGIPLREYSQNGSWDTDEQGFALSMHHQIHCLGLIKHVLVMAERNQTLTSGDFRHMDHCVEYIRQAIMCHGDLTLEPLMPEATRTSIESDTWGSKHYCRDWSVLKEVIWKHSTVGFDDHGFVFDKGHV
ncbi:hypothetical protein GGR53DRAFT_497994 [Hypoxylon sp. FL1150]|nr:hypothetical protein GGR53DRAFT_497994 [Hypoxylon sp. FL1150]